MRTVCIGWGLDNFSLHPRLLDSESLKNLTYYLVQTTSPKRVTRSLNGLSIAIPLETRVP